MSFVGNVQLVQGAADALERVLDIIEREGEAGRGSADLYTRIYAHFGIDEARELTERAATRGIGARRVFALAMPGMTLEAQNALLKTLEEPPADALFIFVIPSPEMLLPTLRSRMQTLSAGPESASADSEAARFLDSSPTDRLKLIEPLLGKGEDDRRDIAAIITFLSSLERMLEKRAAESRARGAPLSGKEGIEAVYRARKYMGDKGALVKPLLEQVALFA